MRAGFGRYVVRRMVFCLLLAAVTGSAYAQTEADNTVVPDDVIAAGHSPAGMAFGPDGKHLYVTSNSDNTVAVIDVSARKQVGELKDAPLTHEDDGCPDNFCRGLGATGIAIAPDGRYAYVSSMRPDAFVRLDLASGHADAATDVERFPQGVVVSANGTRAYVLNVVANTVSVIDLEHFQTVGKPIDLGSGSAEHQPFGRPSALALFADGRRLFVTNGVANEIDVFNTETNERVGVIPDVDAFDLAIDPGSGDVLALFRDGVVAYDANTLKPRQAARYCRALKSYHMTLSPDGKSLALSLPEERMVLVTNRATGLLRAVHRTGEWPLDLAFSPDGRQLAVLNESETGSVSLFNARDSGLLADYVKSNGELFCRPSDTQDTS